MYNYDWFLQGLNLINYMIESNWIKKKNITRMHIPDNWGCLPATKICLSSKQPVGKGGEGTIVPFHIDCSILPCLQGSINPTISSYCILTKDSNACRGLFQLLMPSLMASWKYQCRMVKSNVYNCRMYNCELINITKRNWSACCLN